MHPRPITEQACAKVNLCLHVTGQRADGYHLLDSLVVFADVADVLTAQPGEETSLTIDGPFGADLQAGDDNLVLRASRLVAPNLAVAFRLEKNLPLSSGIGGGSADAAAAIRALVRLMRQNGQGASVVPSPDAIAALGADVPVCLGSEPARMRGIGDDLTPVPGLPSGWIVLANPRVEVPTPKVFRALVTKTNLPLPNALPRWADMSALATWLLQGTRNDLQPPALSIAPQIGDVLAELQAQPGALIARMSGSGATCFALFADRAGAEAAAGRIGLAQAGWWVASGRLGGRFS